MYEIEWLGPPRPDDPPEILGRDKLELESQTEAAAAAIAGFILKCERNQRPYGFRIRDAAGGSLKLWGAHECACKGRQNFVASSRSGLCAMRDETA